jgi:uncharacterized protein YjbI with pentapeptide repeats/DNA-binding XRE family transcriptional regulator
MLKSIMIGNKITEARKKMNITQAQLANLLFVSPQAVGKWERGESMPDIITFDRLGEVLGVDLNYFSGSSGAEAGPVKSGESLAKPSAELPAEGQRKKASWNMSRENLADTDFSGLKNLHEKFSSSNMKNCRFIGSDLSGLTLRSNNIDCCDFTDSDISKSQVQRSNLANNQFVNCLFKESEFSGSNISGCDFSGADLSGAAFKSSNFMKNTMNKATFNHTSFIGTHLDKMVFEGTFTDCFFENCSFYGVTFQDSTLINTFFKNNRKLKRIKFVNCSVDKMTYAFLKNGQADLSGINLLV